MCTISRAMPDQLPVIWPQIQTQIRRALRKGAGDTLSETQLFDGVAHGEIMLWVGHEGPEIMGAWFLATQQRERGKALFVMMAVGANGSSRQNAELFLPRLREYGEMIGAYTIESLARPGAARLLMRLGCKPKAYMMELNDGQQQT